MPCRYSISPTDLQLAELAEVVQEATGETVTLAYVDQGYTGDRLRLTTVESGIDMLMVKLPLGVREFMLLSRRWVVERDFEWMNRF